MTLFWQVFLAIVGLVFIAAAVEAWVKRNRPRRSLAEQFLGADVDTQTDDDGNIKPELGMEAVDMDVIRQSERGNKSAAAFGARDFGFWTRNAQSRKLSSKTKSKK